MKEESWIRAGGGPKGPKNKGGKLENKRSEMNPDAYDAAGGNVPVPALVNQLPA